MPQIQSSGYPACSMWQHSALGCWREWRRQLLVGTGGSVAYWLALQVSSSTAADAAGALRPPSAAADVESGAGEVSGRGLGVVHGWHLQLLGQAPGQLALALPGLQGVCCPCPLSPAGCCVHLGWRCRSAAALQHLLQVRRRRCQQQPSGRMWVTLRCHCGTQASCM